MTKRHAHIDTKLIHAGEPSPRVDGAVSMPIFQCANFETPIRTEYDQVRYIRLNNTPNHDVLHAKLAALENAEAALVTTSGMAAITTSLLTVLGRGDHVLAQDVLYASILRISVRRYRSRYSCSWSTSARNLPVPISNVGRENGPIAAPTIRRSPL